MYSPIEIKRKQKFGSNYWEAFSYKANRTVKLFSDLEYDHWVLVETDPDIKAFCEQPKQITKMINGRIVSTIFDMWVNLIDNQQAFIEVKYISDLKKKDVSLQIKAQKLWCEEYGFKHHIKNEIEIRGNLVLLENRKVILSYIRNLEYPSKENINIILKNISTSKISIGAIETIITNLDTYKIREVICWMLYKGMIKANIDKVRFTSQTEVWI